MTMVLPHTGTAVLEDGSTVSYTYSWVVNFQQVKDASWFALPGIAGFGKLAEVKPVFRVEAILPVAIMFIVTTVETVGDICACVESGMDREATDSELSGGIICDGLGSSFAAALGVLPNTSFAQNVGIISMTKIVNRMALSCGAIFLDPLRTLPEDCSICIHYAAVRTRRCSRYDVCVNSGFRYPAHHKRADYEP